VVPQPILLRLFRGSKNLREASLRESKLRVGNDLEFYVKKMGDVSLVLASRFELVLKDTFLCTLF